MASDVPGVPVQCYLAGAGVDGFYGFALTIGMAHQAQDVGRSVAPVDGSQVP